MLKDWCVRISSFFLLFALVGGTFFSCGKGGQKNNSISSWMKDSGKIKILSTIAQIGDLVSEIGGENVEGLVLIRGSLDPHSYELVKGDDEKIQRAHLVFYNGLGLEHGASLSLQLHSKDTCIAVGEGVIKRLPDQLLTKGGTSDPHVWMDISLWKEATYVIEEALSDLDPKEKDNYHLRGEILRERMELVHQELLEKIHLVPQQKRYLVTSHDAFQYFTRAYLSEKEDFFSWKERFAAPEGFAPDGQLSSLDIQRIVSYLKDHGVRILFPESNVSKDSIRKIASASRELGFDVLLCPMALYGDSMGQENFQYLEMMRHNAETLCKYLQENQGKNE